MVPKSLAEVRTAEEIANITNLWSCSKNRKEGESYSQNEFLHKLIASYNKTAHSKSYAQKKEA
jgi:hypothetical protein